MCMPSSQSQAQLLLLMLLGPWLVAEVAKGTPMKDKRNPLIDLHAPDQDADEKARSSKFFAFIHLLGGCKLML